MVSTLMLTRAPSLGTSVLVAAAVSVDVDKDDDVVDVVVDSGLAAFEWIVSGVP